MQAALQLAAVAIRKFDAQALVVALGFDAHRADSIGVLALDSGDFAAIGEAVSRLDLPTLIVQEGGYGIDVLDPSLTAFLQGLGG